MKAESARQARLLDLQAIDTRLGQLDHARTSLPELAQIEDLEAKASLLDDQLVRLRTSLADSEREVRKAETDVQQVRDRAARDQQRLDAGNGPAKELTALQHELESLARRQSELEEVELEIMERVEATEHDVAELQRGRDELAARLEALVTERDRRFAEIDGERGELAGSRAGVAGEVGDDLVALYEKIRSTSGTGAAALRQRRCGGCQLEVNAIELASIKAAAEDEVIRCEECRRILVRTAESGL